MPIFHLSVRTISRSAGRSAVAAAAYRAGARLRCERTGRTFDYSRRHGVVATRVVVPQSETTVSRQQLWDRAEAAETRCNSTVAREIEIALPSELDARAREVLALGFAEVLAARYGIAVDVAVHEPSKTGDTRNHHAHLLTSTRVWGADGAFGRKVRQLDDRRTGPAEIVAMRESWAAMCNAALEHAGVADTVDHRSHRERGLPDEPGQKLGPAAVGLERRTGAVSRRRADHDAERAAVEQAKPVSLQGQDGVGAGQAGSDRRRAQWLVLGQLRSTFTAATAAAMVGRAHPALQGIPMSMGSERRLTPADSVHRSAARRTSSPSPIRPSSPVARGIPAAQIAKRRWRGYDEAKEAAEIYRRVERELDAELMAQLAARDAEAKRAAALAGRRRLPLTFDVALGRAPALSRVVTSDRSDSVAEGPVRRPAEDQGVDRVIDVRSSPGQDADDVAMPEAGAPEAVDLTRRNLTIMVARELARRHKRSRARLSRLAAVAGLDEAAFAAVAAASDESTFDPAAVAGDPMLADLWTAWEQEDHAKQRVQPDETDASPPTTVDETVPLATPPVEAKPHPAGPVDVEQRADGDVTPTKKRPYGRRDLVVDHAIQVIARGGARGGWSKDVGDALAGLLRTRRDWVWSEAHRVCRARYGTTRPQDIPGEHLRTISRAVIAGTERDSQARKVIRAIDRGLIGRGLG